MQSNQRSFRFYNIKSLAFIAFVFALFINVTAFGASDSHLAFIDSASEFLGLQSSPAPVFSNNVVVAPSATEANGKHNIPTDVSVSLPNVMATPGAISVAITVGDVTGLGVISYDLNVDFNTTVVTPASPA